MAQQNAAAGQSSLTKAENFVKVAGAALTAASAVFQVLRRAGMR